MNQEHLILSIHDDVQQQVLDQQAILTKSAGALGQSHRALIPNCFLKKSSQEAI